jgi:hypothetical protein
MRKRQVVLRPREKEELIKDWNSRKYDKKDILIRYGISRATLFNILKKQKQQNV